MTETTGPNSVETGDGVRKWLAGLVALALLVAYLAFTASAWSSASDAAEMWARKLTIIGGIEALAFAAAGWLFGKEVNREAVDALRKEAGEVRAAAEAARELERERAAETDRARSEATAFAAALKTMSAQMASATRAPVAAGEGADRMTIDLGDLGGLLDRADQVLEAYGE